MFWSYVYQPGWAFPGINHYLSRIWYQQVKHNFQNASNEFTSSQFFEEYVPKLGYLNNGQIPVPQKIGKFERQWSKSVIRTQAHATNFLTVDLNALTLEWLVQVTI